MYIYMDINGNFDPSEYVLFFFLIATLIHFVASSSAMSGGQEKTGQEELETLHKDIACQMKSNRYREPGDWYF